MTSRTRSANLSESFKPYLFEYRHQGADWGIEILATSPADAQERLKALAWARYKGETVAKIKVPGGGALSFLRRLIVGR
ncbi:hypothetical protein [Tianweitania sediminis]|uniref:Uncharacterized protein n=1 Tax=Tianweitania sediminis TaxID=1502156 RepID=A0A8J7UIZ1_9HYPH|nr:hypothetical protein [Tianweitania sediminis]MBP0439443.1 hypothetical protein [Tianweitania sediminis]